MQKIGKKVFIFWMLGGLLAFSGCSTDSSSEAEKPSPGRAGEESFTSSSPSSSAQMVEILPSTLEALAEADPETGKEKYTRVCAACHGTDAKGIPGLGQNLFQSTFLWQTPLDRVIHKLLVEGIPLGDSLNQSSTAMPPMGSTYGLTEQDMKDIFAYLLKLGREEGVLPGDES